MLELINDNNPYPTVMSNMLEPTELDTAMSPKPFLATMTLVMRSGMEVPAARIVRPMISSVMPIVSPTCGVKQKSGIVIRTHLEPHDVMRLCNILFIMHIKMVHRA